MATKKSAAKVLSAAKLQGLQTRLNKDKALRARFVKEPGEVLRSEGVELGSAKEAQIAKYLGQMTAPQRAQFQAELTRVKIGISVRVRIRVNIGVTI